MRFVLGFAIGLGVGFAGALLLAPDRSRREVDGPAGSVDGGPAAFERDNDILGAARSVIRSIQDQVNEAMGEAKKAQEETEAELRARYEKTARRKGTEEGK
jgi:hypothetical protein